MKCPRIVATDWPQTPMSVNSYNKFQSLADNERRFRPRFQKASANGLLQGPPKSLSSFPAQISLEVEPKFLFEPFYLTSIKYILSHVYLEFIYDCRRQCAQPSWRSWLARQSHNLKVVSSSLTEGIFIFFFKKLRSCSQSDSLTQTRG